MVQNIINKKNGKIEKGIGSLYGGENLPCKIVREGGREREGFWDSETSRRERERTGV